MNNSNNSNEDETESFVADAEGLIVEDDPEDATTYYDHHQHGAARMGAAILRRQTSSSDSNISSAGDEDGMNETNHCHGYQTVASDTSVVPRHHYRWERVFLRTLFPDRALAVWGVPLVEGPFAVKLLKFLAFTFAGIFTMFHFVRWVDWENDHYLTLADIWVYESNLIIMDAVVFFVVGRLHRQRGVDRLAWLGWSILANIYSSYITTFSFLKHAFTLYEMHCTWPVTLWLFVALVAILVAGLILVHVQYAVQKGVFVQKLLELALCAVLLLLPYSSSPFFHLHHWYAGWLAGMHFNFDEWWSRAAMAWCWGCYINGIAVYGRDPVLTCGYAYHLSLSLGCPFLKCYVEGIHRPANDTNHTHVEPMLPPDWRNCSAATYHG